MTLHCAQRRRRGFTLIELSVTLTVAGVLAMLAWGGYEQYLLKARRAEGRAALLQVLLQEERQFAYRHSYRAFRPGVEELEFKWFSGDSPPRSAYELAAQACQDQDLRSCVRVSATPVGTHRDPQCGTLYADTRGRRGSEGDDGDDGKRCW